MAKKRPKIRKVPIDQSSAVPIWPEIAEDLKVWLERPSRFSAYDPYIDGGDVIYRTSIFGRLVYIRARPIEAWTMEEEL